MVRSPIACLDRAVEERPAAVAIHFADMPLRERDGLVELCAVLKRNSRTKETCVVTLLHEKHRELVAVLERASVDFVTFIGGRPPTARAVRDIIDGLGPADRLEPHLSAMCPYLHYEALDGCREMRVCGAYLDRMVLGGRRLHEVCESCAHLACEHFLHPRRRP
ncbi:MAG: hypothetical protein MUC88_10690 [Planctomycetes bacterium]|nr:hypothetical protein [Planctomycetota bacterium]